MYEFLLARSFKEVVYAIFLIIESRNITVIFKSHLTLSVIVTVDRAYKIPSGL